MTTRLIGNNILSVLRSITFATCVYYVWQERNNKIFRDTQRDWETVAKLIEDTVRLKLMSISVKNSYEVREMEKKWLVKLKYRN